MIKINSFLLMTSFIDNLKRFTKINPYIYLFFLLITLIIGFLSYRKEKYFKVFILIYILFLIINLFFRTPSNEEQINKKFYLFEWLKIIFSNKIVFVNIIGNILLFIPLGYIVTNVLLNNFFLVKIIIGLTFIIIIEIIQYVTKLGIFDLIDILLNIVGFMIGLIMKRKAYEQI